MPNQYAHVHRLLPDPSTAVTECAMLIRAEFKGKSPDLIFAFVAGYQGVEFDMAMPKLKALTGCENVVGVSCTSVVSGDQEIEHQSGISLWAARFDGAVVTPLHLEFQSHGDEHFFEGWPASLEQSWPEDATLFLLSEPFSFPVEALLERINDDHPTVKAFGGIADGASRPGDARLLLNDQTFDTGAVAVVVSGVPIDSVVSQGCRPIGQPAIVTAAERNIVQSLGGHRAFEVLKQTYDALPTQDKARVEQGLHLGVAMTEWKDEFGYGDFLIRNVINIDESNACFSLSDFVRVGKTVQFHIRDHQSASLELESMLSQAAARSTRSVAAPQSALIFTCNGRGTHLFPEPHHDAQMVQKILGQSGGDSTTPMPAAGFFAAGEIGSVGGKNFLHGFTASIAIFG